MKNIMPKSSLDPTHYAGFWVRFCAACIDLVLFIPLYLGLGYVFNLATSHLPGAADAAANAKTATDYLGSSSLMGGAYNEWFQGIFLVVSIVIYAWFFASRWQASPGMHLLKFHICDTEGQRIGFWHAMVWNITALFGVAICCAGVLYLQSKFDITAVNDLLKSCQEQNIAFDDCTREMEDLIHIPFKSFIELVYGASGMAVFLLFIWALSIALPRDKTGFHNLLCRTRFVKGRAPKSGQEVITEPV